ncbi:hypothetical protein SAMN05216436_106122 [bacterium A37T11]|nr:hypothetical protein SAMN05216436_106122 [bacterium A37T11]
MCICGHYYLSEEMTRNVLEKGKEAYAEGAELEVVKFTYILLFQTLSEIEKDRDFWRNEYGRVLKENNALKAEVTELNNEIKTLKRKK